MFVQLLNQRRRRAGVAPISADRALIGTAGRMMPSGPLAGAASVKLVPIRRALPPNYVWRRIQTPVGSCGGCGTRPTDSDVRFFFNQWWAEPSYRAVLLDPGYDRIGLTIRADGSGRKLAVAVMAGG